LTSAACYGREAGGLICLKGPSPQAQPRARAPICLVTGRHLPRHQTSSCAL